MELNESNKNKTVMCLREEITVLQKDCKLSLTLIGKREKHRKHVHTYYVRLIGQAGQGVCLIFGALLVLCVHVFWPLFAYMSNI